MRKKLSTLRRALGAGALAALTLWAAAVTAGSETASAALSSLRASIPLDALRWELGDLGRRDGLSTAAALAIGESPLLLSARTAVAERRRQETSAAVPPAEDDEDRRGATAPVEETPLPPPADSGIVIRDNGVPARTLVPTDPSGYTVCGLAYISNSTDYDLSVPPLTEPFEAKLTAEEPQILILHTHGSESYTPAEGAEVSWSGDYRTTDPQYNVVHVGDVMADTFGAAGISVLHDRTLYDYPNYDGAYDRALTAIQGYLERYPSIRFVLDVHRDAIEDGEGNQYKVISPIDGVGAAAQLTLIMGSDGGGLTHPKWRENLKLAVSIQQEALEDYPTLMRPILLRNSRYNQHATTGSLLVEVGAAGNSPEEAALAGRLFAREMAAVLKGEDAPALS